MVIQDMSYVYYIHVIQYTEYIIHFLIIDGDNVQATAPLDSALVSQAGSTSTQSDDKSSGDKTGVHL